MTHVGLLALRDRVNLCVSKVLLHDVRGPRMLSLPSVRLPSDKPVQADVLGWLPLSEEEEVRLDAWLAWMRTRVDRVDYLALPSQRIEQDPQTGEAARWHFSCAGFVVFAYFKATGIYLVDEGALPASNEGVIAEIWSQFLSGRSEREERRRAARLAQVGLGSSPPWPVLLPGHVLSALNAVGADNDRTCLPYRPTDDDAWFPREPVAAKGSDE